MEEDKKNYTVAL